jgi:hypothetical protein
MNIINDLTDVNNVENGAHILITARDLRVMLLVGSSGIASLAQLDRQFWPDADTGETALIRLSQLESAGYLQSMWWKYRGQVLLTYTLTYFGASVLPEEVQERVQAGWPPRALIEQQLISNDAHTAAEVALSHRGALLVDWRSAFELQRQYAREDARARSEGRYSPTRAVPDAQMVVEERDGRRAVVNFKIEGPYYGATLPPEAKQDANSCWRETWVRLEARSARVVDGPLPRTDC